MLRQITMNYSEPKRFEQQNQPLDNFADLANRTIIKEKGLFSAPLSFDFKTTVDLKNMDDLVLVTEQDYYLNQHISPKFSRIYADPDLLEATLRLVELYLTASSQTNDMAEKVKRYALSNLNMI